jgi:hypothetical protein
MFQIHVSLVPCIDNASTMEGHDRILQRITERSLGYRVSLLIGVKFQRGPGNNVERKFDLHLIEGSNRRARRMNRSLPPLHPAVALETKYGPRGTGTRVPVAA